MKNYKEILKVAQVYSKKLQKKAAYPVEETVKPVLNNLLDILKNTYRDLFKTVKGVSRLEVENKMDHVYINIVTDVDPQDYQSDRTTQRKGIVTNEVQNKLPGYFGGTPFKVSYSEFPA